MATNNRFLTREQLAKFLPDHETIKVFESLINDSATTQTDLTQITALVEATTLGSTSSSAEIELGGARDADFIDFQRYAPFVTKLGRLGWRADEDTLVIDQAGDVVQPIGLASYVRVLNETGGNLVVGTCASFVGTAASGGQYFISADEFIADGTMPSDDFLGLFAQTIADDGIGRVVIFGVISGIDTTGTPYTETWADGDTLYVNPNVSGGLTNVPPDAPDLLLPVAVVLEAAASGSINVRPPIQQNHYASFIRTSDLSPSAINTADTIVLSSSVIANGFTLGTPASRVVASAPGLYEFAARVQLVASAGTPHVWLWFSKNGTSIANSATRVTIAATASSYEVAAQQLVSMQPTDYVELMFATDVATMNLDNIAATAFAPQVPAVILNVNQIKT